MLSTAPLAEAFSFGEESERPLNDCFSKVPSTARLSPELAPRDLESVLSATTTAFGSGVIVWVAFVVAV